MRALLSIETGGADRLVLKEVADPIPFENEVLIAVKACGVNYPDVLIIEDRYQFKPERPFAPGGEVAGVVEALGPGAKGLDIGQHVIAFCGWGGMAEKLVVPAARCIPIPDVMPFDEAAALILTYGTALHALKDRARLIAGETVLILGAAGGVGLATIELGKRMGARIVAAVSSEDKAALAREAGADATMIYPRGPFDKDGKKALAGLFKDACGKGGADVVFDPVGGEYAEAALRAIAWEGRYLVVGFPSGIPSIPLNLPLLKSCQIVGVFWGEFANRDPAGNAANNQELLDLYAKSAIRPRISMRVPLADGAEALRMLESRRATGKLVVTMS